MNRFVVLGLALAAGALFAGCRGDDVMVPDTGTPRRDTGVAITDASPRDAGQADVIIIDFDTGTSTTTSMDAGRPDARADGGRPDAGDGGLGFTVTTVQNASRLINRNVQIVDAIVVAEHHYAYMGGSRSTFYIQDEGTAGRGIAVFKNNTDSTMMPVVGAKVTVKGHLSRFSGSLQVQSQRTAGVALEITSNGTGVVMGGAEAPAGEPLLASSPIDYRHDLPDNQNHQSEIGNVIKFDGPLEAIPAPEFVVTSADGGTTRQGFEVMGGLWVSNTHVRIDCLQGVDGGIPSLKNGIRGVWDRHQDFNADSGMPGMRPPLIGVLFPTSCEDLVSP